MFAAVKTAETALGANGCVIVRPSGTEPPLRIMVEAKSKDICNKHIADIEKVVRDKGYAAETVQQS